MCTCITSNGFFSCKSAQSKVSGTKTSLLELCKALNAVMQVVSHNFLEANSKVLQVEKNSGETNRWRNKQVSVVKHIGIHIGIGRETPSAPVMVAKHL